MVTVMRVDVVPTKHLIVLAASAVLCLVVAIIIGATGISILRKLTTHTTQVLPFMTAHNTLHMTALTTATSGTLSVVMVFNYLMYVQRIHIQY